MGRRSSLLLNRVSQYSIYGQMPRVPLVVEPLHPHREHGCNGSDHNVESADKSILWMELLPIVLAAAVWGRVGQKLRVMVHCDNMGTVAVVNSGYSKVVQ